MYPAHRVQNFLKEYRRKNFSCVFILNRRLHCGNFFAVKFGVVGVGVGPTRIVLLIRKRNSLFTNHTLNVGSRPILPSVLPSIALW